MNTEIHYETLDPENWDEMRALSHRMVVLNRLGIWRSPVSIPVWIASKIWFVFF